MMKSLYSGVSGLKVHNQRMDVIGNNIANVNTTAYKASAVTFKDVYYQTKQQASAGTNTSGGVNPRQVGYGASLGTINQVMTQSGLTYSDSIYDCALEGEGFFQVMDASGNIFYSRSGIFAIDNAENLTDANGNIVLGVSGDPTGIPASSQRISINIPPVQNEVASVTTTVKGGYEVTLSASGYGPEGNISITLQNSEVPFATMSGTTLNVQLDLKQNFENQQQFEDAVNAAIRAGGVNLPDNVMPISIRFDSLPADTSPASASNVMEFQIADPEDPEAEPAKMFLKFEVNDPGDFGNKYEIAMKTSKTATGVTASWTNSVLTITVPGGVDEETGEPLYPVTLEDIQNALNKAAGMVDVDESGDWTGGTLAKMITVTAVSDITGAEEGGTAPDEWNFINSLKTNTKRIGLHGGNDNFYNQVAKDLSTIKLTNGRYEGPQTHTSLTTIFIDQSGVIYGEHPVHGRLLLGRIDLATFDNAGGLEQTGTSYWRATLASGEPQVKIGGEEGAADIVSGALEMSNVDLSQEFSDMIITQRGFQANSRIITVSDTMLEELINLKR